MVPSVIAPAMVCHCLLIEGPGGLILVDTGLGTQDLLHPMRRLTPLFLLAAHPRLSPEETAIARIRALGHDPGDVRDIALTHLDLDHAGGISDFPEATIHLHRAEHEAMVGGDLRYRRAQWAHGPRWALHEPDGERWMGFEAVHPLPGCDDVLLVPLQGHTAGHSGVAIRTGSGWLLHAGDAFFHHRQLLPEPSAPPGLALFQRLSDHDPGRRRHNQARLRELALAPDSAVRIVCAHDPVYLEGGA